MSAVTGEFSRRISKNIEQKYKGYRGAGESVGS